MAEAPELEIPTLFEVNRKLESVYKLRPGEVWCLTGNCVIIAHPKRQPFSIDLDTGKRRGVKPSAFTLKTEVKGVW